MRYRYVKAPVVNLPHRQAVLLRVLPLFLVVAGIVLFSSAAVPIFFYQFFVSPRFVKLVKPAPDDYLLQSQPGVLGEKAGLDMTNASNWFPAADYLPPRPSKITHYTLSIPKLGIEEAIVQIGGEDLKTSLIHYQGTAFPGQFGNAVVFGHSVLPQFFNPKNYLTIFSTLPELRGKDEIFINFDGVRYRYLVEEMVEVQPEDISVLEQRYDDSYLTLITCVPPGTYLRRLVVRARLKGK